MKNIILRMVLLIVFLLTDCTTSISVDPTNPPPYASADVPTQTEKPEFIYSTPTRIISNSVSSVTPTIVITPTLTSEERENVTINLFSTNGGCNLPCWWGFMPGKAKWEQVNNFLVRVGARSTKKEVSEKEDIFETASFNINDNSISNRLSFDVNDGTVKSIYINGDGIQNPTLFKNLWKEYYPKVMLRKYGEPNQILLYLPNGPYEEPAKLTNYELWIVYNNIGIIIKYTGSVRNEVTTQLCPFSNNGINLPWSISILLGSQSNAKDFLNSLQNYGYPPDYLENWQTLESVTGVKVKELYNSLIKNNNIPCFSVTRTE